MFEEISLQAKINADKIYRYGNYIGSEKNSLCKNDIQLKKACQELSSFFIHQLVKAMRATVPESGLIRESTGREIYTSMLDSQFAKEMATGGGIGLSDILYNQIEKTEAASENKK